MTPTPRTGAPVWLDLSTNDMTASQQFYAKLFGWQFSDPGPAPAHYTTISCGPAVVGGIMDTSTMTCPDGGPIDSGFEVYLASPDEAATTAAATKAGGQVLVAPQQIPPDGSFALIKDPGGASVGIWQAGTVTSFDLPLQPGTPVWFECRNLDFTAASDFYTEVFNWTVEPMMGAPAGSPRYATNGSPSDAEHCPAVCGLVDSAEMSPPHNQSRWQIFFATPDLDQAMSMVTALGGRLDRPGQSPFGRFVQVWDPHGAAFMLNELPAPASGLEATND